MPKKIVQKIQANETTEVSAKYILTHIMKGVRTDFGKNGKDTIRARLIEDGIPVNRYTIKAYMAGATRTRDTVSKYMQPRVETLRNLTD